MSMLVRGARPAPTMSGERTEIRFPLGPTLHGTEIELVSARVLGAAQRSQLRTVFLDFTGVKYLTASTLGKLVALHTTLREKGKQLILTSLAEHLREMFEITMLNTLLEIQ